jgi:catechol 2,3-dioxygenase-like lactoylglutathione lyase family enzyme
MFTATHIDHVEIFVRDLDAAAQWYAKVLGLREIHRWDPEPIFIGIGDTALALFKAPANALLGKPDQSYSRSWHRVAWRTDRAGFKSGQEHLTSLGIPFRGPIDHKIAHSIYFQDPDGHLLEITTYEVG